MISNKILNEAPKNKKEGELPSKFLTSQIAAEIYQRRLSFF